jgi:hypothetical protein
MRGSLKGRFLALLLTSRQGREGRKGRKRVIGIQRLRGKDPACAGDFEFWILNWGGTYRAEAGGALLRSVSAGSLSYAGRPQRAGWGWLKGARGGKMC